MSVHSSHTHAHKRGNIKPIKDLQDSASVANPHL